MCKLLFDFAPTAINCVSLGLWSLIKDFFTIRGTADSWNVLHYEQKPHQFRLNASSKHKKRETM